MVHYLICIEVCFPVSAVFHGKKNQMLKDNIVTVMDIFTEKLYFLFISYEDIMNSIFNDIYIFKIFLLNSHFDKVNYLICSFFFGILLLIGLLKKNLWVDKLIHKQQMNIKSCVIMSGGKHKQIVDIFTFSPILTLYFLYQWIIYHEIKVSK